MAKRFTWLLALAFTLCAGAAWAAPLKIGVLAPISGSSAADGNDIVKGVKTAVEVFKAEGGMPGFDAIEVEVQDSACDPRQAVAGANKLANSKVAGVIGAYCSSATLPASDVLNEEKITMITPASTNPKVTQRGYKYMFRMCGLDIHQSDAAAKFMKDQLKAKSVFIVDDKTTYSQHLAEYVAEEAKKLGITVAAHEHVNEGDMDYSAILTKVKAANPDVFYMSLQNNSAGIRMIKQFRQLGLKCAVLSQDAVYHPNFIKEAPEQAQGVFFTFGYADKNSPVYKKFLEKYTAMHGEPGAYSAYAFDSAYALLTAIKAAKSTKADAIRAELMKLNLPGASKVIKFQDNGDSGSNYVVFKVEGDKFKEYWNPATGKLF
ncbi:Leucine-specific-binding protein [Fundidesulfovibrio magnetotacticus]|uniref:Leucine-specific-binding protein n=1 Tax=Fundidesulfovibrio magnetotacticus TaxID=2730080 RepID=A0A6V8LWJ8_9BACT|nr:branched-chain amino acid ABC transporter substrate-binding protein [Fundidesulfovibrio magnetotacticus]GFK92645.1 Leucine-specific-binding protein [Fundidesulfovibrio magnetotacticus]